jgi:hypothetical protein
VSKLKCVIACVEDRKQGGIGSGGREIGDGVAWGEEEGTFLVGLVGFGRSGMGRWVGR